MRAAIFPPLLELHAASEKQVSGRDRGAVEPPGRNLIVDERVPSVARGSTESRLAWDIEAADVPGEILQERRWEFQEASAKGVHVENIQVASGVIPLSNDG